MPGKIWRRLPNKIKAGADSAITQFFFNADGYLRFVEDVGKLGVTVPIVPGIMPITNYMQLKGFAEKAAIDMPRWIEQRLRGYGDDSASIRAFGLDVTSALCDRLLREGAPGLHFYNHEPSSSFGRNMESSQSFRSLRAKAGQCCLTRNCVALRLFVSV